MIVTDSLTHRNWRFLTFDSSLTAALGQSDQPGDPRGSGQFGRPGQLYQSGNSMHDFTICIICALHNFQFYLAHLWTDFQSCLIVTVRSSAYYATDTCQIENNVAWLQKTVI